MFIKVDKISFASHYHFLSFPNILVLFNVKWFTCRFICITVLCKSNANVFCQNLWLFFGFRQKYILIFDGSKFWKKAIIICDAYCFQLCEFPNVDLLRTKIDFKFSSKNLPRSINGFKHLVRKIVFYIIALLKHSLTLRNKHFVLFIYKLPLI